MGDDFKQAMGKEIKRARRHGHLNQAELGERIGVSKSAVCKYETGASDITASKMYDIAQVCDYTFQIPLKEQDFIKGFQAIIKQASHEKSAEDEQLVQQYLQCHQKTGIPQEVQTIVNGTAHLADIYDETGMKLPSECIENVIRVMIEQERRSSMTRRLRAYIEKFRELEKRQEK